MTQYMTLLKNAFVAGSFDREFVVLPLKQPTYRISREAFVAEPFKAKKKRGAKK